MNLPRFEKLIFFGCPWLFGMVMIISGIAVRRSSTNKLLSILLVCSGLICMSLYCVCALIVKIIEKR
ncbi:MAG: hypothetical protein ISS47_06815 [Candidatus Omnitrophica bacterium]|nr:hypothetical protein [Candidatus Omnitrophota bacterium]